MAGLSCGKLGCNAAGVGGLGRLHRRHLESAFHRKTRELGYLSFNFHSSLAEGHLYSWAIYPAYPHFLMPPELRMPCGRVTGSGGDVEAVCR